ncbi:MAG: hypothetical protein JEZ07_12190 [Phycisphaerae bacterium]|nr:hypothetical protein [Phycisphaerae bacterium]
MLKKINANLFLVMVLALITMASIASQVQAQNSDWTMLVYLDGDNDLEGDAISDFIEMASVGSNDNVKIVVMLDRVSGYDSSYGNWTDTRRGLIAFGDVPDPNWGQSMGELNMANPQTLADFANWGMTTYPADNYALVLWNHGGGWRNSTPDYTKQTFKAVCWDDTSSGDSLYMAEVRAALESIEAASGNPTLLGFDACLMGMTEVAYEIRNHAQVLVGSADLEPNDGWPYDLILTHLNADSTMTAAELGSVIVNDYYNSYQNDQTQSAIDLTQLDALATEINSFGQTLRNNWDSNVLNCVTAAQSLRTRLDSVIIAEAHGDGWPGANGLAIYFPMDGPEGSYDSSYSIYPIGFPGASGWDDFLVDFTTTMANSWIATARGQAQVYDGNENTDLYDFCDELISNAPDSLSVFPEDDLAFTGEVGGPFLSAINNCQIRNVGTENIDWQITWTESWVVVDSAITGNLGPAETADVIISIAAEANSLPNGIYSDTLTFNNLTTGLSRTREIILIVGGLDSFTEEFVSDFDLDNKSIVFTPDNSNSYYSACIMNIDEFPTNPAIGSRVNVGDDDFSRISISESIPFYGNEFNEIFIGSNGFITFEQGDTGFPEDSTEHFALKRISVLCADLNPEDGGWINYQALADRIVVSWIGIPEYGYGNSNNFQLELFFDGVIRMSWLQVDSSTVIVGLSNGTEPVAFSESDMSGYSSCVIEPPAMPTEPFPADGALGVSLNAILSWNNGAKALVDFDLYFGLDSNPVDLVAADRGSTSWDPTHLTPGATYYWKVIAKNENGSTEGPVWNFTTAGLVGDINHDGVVNMIDFSMLAENWMLTE